MLPAYTIIKPILEFKSPTVLNRRKIANIDNIWGNAFKISNSFNIPFLPANRYLEKAYAATIATLMERTIVPQHKITVF